MIVYCLISDNCDSEQLLAIYSTEDLAKKAKSKLSCQYNKEIIGWELDTQDLSRWE